MFMLIPRTHEYAQVGDKGRLRLKIELPLLIIWLLPKDVSWIIEEGLMQSQGSLNGSEVSRRVRIWDMVFWKRLNLSLLALKVEQRATHQGMKAVSTRFEKGKKMDSPLVSRLEHRPANSLILAQ